MATDELHFPSDPTLCEKLADRVYGLDDKSYRSFRMTIDAFFEKRNVEPDRVAEFNMRYDVFILEPDPGPVLVIVGDRQTGRRVLASVHFARPPALEAVNDAAVALDVAATNVVELPERWT